VVTAKQNLNVPIVKVDGFNFMTPNIWDLFVWILVLLAHILTILDFNAFLVLMTAQFALQQNVSPVQPD
jgi:hypothetical protein